MTASTFERSTAWLLLAITVAGALAGCARARRTPDDTIVVIVDVNVADIDPRYTQNSVETKVSRLVASGLTTVDQASLEARPLLAERIELVDPLTWVVTVRADARFSDGSPVTAADVVYTYRSTMDPAAGSRYRKGFEERFDAVERVDERRVRFRLKQPLATFLTDIDYGIVSEQAALAAGGRFKNGSVVGAGPFLIERIKTGELRLRRNPHYLEGPPPIEHLVIKTIADANARLLMLVGGSADFTQNGVRLDLLGDIAARPRLRVVTGPSAVLSYLMFNNEDPVLRDPRVRHALALAIDRDTLVRKKFGGHALVATGLLPPAHWAYDGNVTRYDYDPARAAALLDEAGYPDPDGPGGRPRLSFTYKTSADAFRVSVARLIAQQLGEIGVEVEVRSFEFATFFADVKKGNFQLASMQTSEIIEPDMYWVYFHSERIPTKEFPDNHNRWRYRNAEVDALIEAGRRELDREKRRAIYAELQRRLADDLPILPLWFEHNVAVMNRDLDGYEVLPNARLSPLRLVTKGGRSAE